MGSYPMTQVYQHKEDSERGDITISLKLGILGTFHFTAIAFFISNFGFLAYYYLYHSMTHVIAFQLFLIPVLFYFSIWYLKVRKNFALADFEHTMRLNLISSLMLNIYFLLAALY
jgi:1,4-dihydroxy-2-naphthoate octaprenyltransferase